MENRTSDRIRHDERGFSLVELLLAGALTSVGVAATIATFASTGRTTLAAQQHEVAVQQAQAELDRIATLPYGALALTGAPGSATDPGDPRARVEGSALRVRPDLVEPLVMQPGGGQAAAVDPGPQQFAVGGGEAQITGRIHRFVTWRDESCPEALCEGAQDTKRVTIAAVVDPSPGARQAAPVWLATVIADPNDAPPGSQAVPDGGPGRGEPVKAQAFYLYDTPCGQGTRQAPSTSHATRNTASVGPDAGTASTCGKQDAADQPDLMGRTPPSGDGATALYKYSSDLGGEYAGGLALMGRGSSCAGSYPAADAANPSGPSKWSVHAWSTAEFTQVFHLNRLVTVSLFTSTVGGARGDGKLCATLIDRATVDGGPTDRVLGSAVHDVASWPTSVRRVTFSFELAQEEDVLPNHRLVLALHLRGESDNDVVLVYDHPLYPSLLEVATATPL